MRQIKPLPLVGLAAAAIVVILLGAWVLGNALTDSEGNGPEPLRDRDVFGAEQPDDTEDTRMSRESCSSDEAVSWSDAGSYVGSDVALIGPVLEVGESDLGLTVTVGSRGQAEEPPLVQVVLTDNALRDIEGNASDFFAGKQVCAVGVIQPSDGQLRLVINETSDILVL